MEDVTGGTYTVAYAMKARDASKPGTRENQSGSSSLPGCSCTGSGGGGGGGAHRSAAHQGCVLFGQGQGRWLALPPSEGEIAISRTGVARGKCSQGHGRSARSNQPFLAFAGIDARPERAAAGRGRVSRRIGIDKHFDVPTNFVGCIYFAETRGEILMN